MADSFLVQIYNNRQNQFNQEYSKSISIKQAVSSPKPIHNNYNKSSPSKIANLVRQEYTLLCKAFICGIVIGALVCSIALATTLALWLKPSSSNSTSTNTPSTTIQTSTVTIASTIPLTASTTAICSLATTAATTTAASGSGTTIFSVNSPCSSASSYFPIVFYYIAKASNETLTFGVQNNPASTYFDDISVMSNGVDLLCNGGFENGTQICWQGAYHLQSGCGYSGSYCYSDPVVGSVDYISQSFNTTPGALLNISFWTYWTGSGSGIVTIVTITP